VPQVAETTTAAPPRARTARAIVGLGATQLIGWGTTFSPLAVLGTTMGRDLGLSREMTFAGMTVMLLVSAAIAPRVGRTVDRLGARRMMMAGSLVVAAGMVSMALAQGLVSYFAAWVLCGLAQPMMLTTSALPGLVQVVGANARRAITALTLISGLTSTVFMPLNAVLLETIGWRNAFLVFALLHVAVCLPIHALVLTRNWQRPAAGGGSGSGGIEQGILTTPEQRRTALVLIAVWSCLEGLMTWGLYVQAIDVFRGLGLSAAAAVGVWALVGPSQAGARLAELLSGGRFTIMTVALASAMLSPLAFLILLPLGVTAWSASAFTICLGLGHGLFAIARNMLPLTLFGVREYGAYMGRLTLPQNIVNAAAPVLSAAVLSRAGPMAVLWMTLLTTSISFLAVLVLVRFCREAAGDRMGGASPH
jgi:predicted MFS family arabinose efflux permease